VLIHEQQYEHIGGLNVSLHAFLASALDGQLQPSAAQCRVVFSVHIGSRADLDTAEKIWFPIFAVWWRLNTFI